MAQLGPQDGWVPLLGTVPPGWEGAAECEGFDAGAEAEELLEEAGAGAGAATEGGELAGGAGGGGV